MIRPLNRARRALIAALTVVAVLATFAVVAPAASAEVAPPGALEKASAHPGSLVRLRISSLQCETGGPPPFIDVYLGEYHIGRLLAGSGDTWFIVPEQVGAQPVYGVVAPHESVDCGGVTVEYGTLNVVARSTTTTLEVADAPYHPGKSVTLSATVTGELDDIPTGSVRFRHNGNATFDVPVDSTGVAEAGSITLGLGDHTITAEFTGTDGWLASTTTVTHTVTPEPLTITFPATAIAVGSPTWIYGELISQYNDLWGFYPESLLTASVDGDPVSMHFDPYYADTHSMWGGASFGTESLPHGTHTVVVTAPAHGNFATSTTTFTLEITPRTVAPFTASAPGTVTYGTPFDVVVNVPAAAGVTIDGTINVYSGPDLVGTSGPVSGVGQLSNIRVPVEGLDAGDAQELRVEFVNSTRYSDATTAVTVNVQAAPVDVELRLDGDYTAGVHTEAEIMVSSDSGIPAGTVELFVNGVSAGTTAVDPVDGTGRIPFVTPAGFAALTAVFTPGTGNHQTGTTSTFAGYARTDVTGTFELTYSAPAAANSTGLLAGEVCFEATHPNFDQTLFADTSVRIATVIDDTFINYSTTVLVDLGHCWGIALSGADLLPGVYLLHADFYGNDYLWDTNAQGRFTVLEAPTEISLGIVGAPGETFGLQTTFAAQLSAPVPGHAQGGDITFYVNGEPVTTVAVTDGAAQLTTTLRSGSAEVTATYSGDAMHAAASSAPMRLDVAQAAATVAVSVSPTPPVAGEQATLRATVTINEPAAAALFPGATLAAAGEATGTVTFYVDGAPVGTAALTGGAAELPHVFTPGTHTVTASYSGDADTAPVSAAESADAVVTVAPAPTPPQAPTPPNAPNTPGLVVIEQVPAPTGDTPAATTPVAAGEPTLPRTGSSTTILVLLGAALLTAGVTLTGRRDRRG